MDRRVESAWWVLRIALGAGPVIAGADKFFNLIANWPMYLSPLAVAVLPIDPDTFMRIVGGVEILVGLAILTNATRIGAWVLMAWLIGLAINLASTGMFFDLAVRDVEIAVAAFALARLTEAREAQRVAAAGSAEFGTVFKGGLV